MFWNVQKKSLESVFKVSNWDDGIRADCNPHIRFSVRKNGEGVVLELELWQIYDRWESGRGKRLMSNQTSDLADIGKGKPELARVIQNSSYWGQCLHRKSTVHSGLAITADQGDSVGPSKALNREDVSVNLMINTKRQNRN